MAGSQKSAHEPPAEVDPDDGMREDVDAFFERNREVLTASIEQSRAEFAQGIHSEMTIQDIIVAGMKRYEGR